MDSIDAVVSKVGEASFALPQSLVVDGYAGVGRSRRQQRLRWLPFLAAV